MAADVLSSSITRMSILQSNYRNHRHSRWAIIVHDLPEQKRQMMPEEQSARHKTSKCDEMQKDTKLDYS